MTTTVKSLLDEARAAVPRIAAPDAEALHMAGTAIFLDVRDAPEIEKTGAIPGALAISRGMLEFRADPASPAHDPRLDRDKTIILYCASGGRSALGGKVLQAMGYRVADLGGIAAWTDSGRTLVPAGGVAR